MKVMAGGTARRAAAHPAIYAKSCKRDGALAAALKWVLRNPNVDTTIPSMTDMDQLDENLKAMARPFSAADEKLLAHAPGAHRARSTAACAASATAQCRQGLPVPDMLRFLTYADGYGQFALGRERFLELPPEHAAVRCGDCSGLHGGMPARREGGAGNGSRAQEMFA